MTIVSFNEDATVGTDLAGEGAFYAIQVPIEANVRIDRVEFMTGAPVTVNADTPIRIFADQSGVPAVASMADAQLQVAEGVDWQGADLNAPLSVDSGTTIWVEIEPGTDMRMPQTDSGSDVSYVWGFEHGDWIAVGASPVFSAPWMLRLIGCPQ